ncbi:hypothetical protein M717_10970 [Neisseria gonorrhoeae SK33414]|nr:hypothetical protein T556_05365 [Neisseria gonorrhoeae NG-k51.05]KLR76045.1 hypothetical protein M717_10970 [Neisseria gonorrhoeae SK33414]KLR77487.1 hypothetical protein M680_00300 [Neisseria gonorrhoeae SK8976]KLR83423.1 hypothetical protein M675_03135 [Neisseria gonorrhoeae SK1902]KLR85063.1 hypothetical protein M684_09010 [Neisseria gonorrhoeae SK15454]KLR88316.1 hypothetical protein M702_02510 [Neisseria gonorrhoeae SK28355]KLR93597.1 hypothetical protein M678_09845 [Neisseria gonorrh
MKGIRGKIAAAPHSDGIGNKKARKNRAES